MTFNRSRVEYALEGSSNLIAWKDHMEEVIDDTILLEYIKRDVVKPTKSDA